MKRDETERTHDLLYGKSVTDGEGYTAETAVVGLYDVGRDWCMMHGYVLTNKVTHVRLLPAHSKHAFTYPTLALLVSLDVLERSALDLPIWPLGYAFRFGSLWALVGLRSDGYLAHKEAKRTSIRTKLDRVSLDSGAITAPSDIRDVWMMTMPAICAFEGINPLTVYYCYRSSGEVSVVVLEASVYFLAFCSAVTHLFRCTTPLVRAMCTCCRWARTKTHCRQKGKTVCLPLFFTPSQSGQV